MLNPPPVDDLFYFNPTAMCKISLGEAYRNKMALNEQKYPVDTLLLFVTFPKFDVHLMCCTCHTNYVLPTISGALGKGAE